LALPGAAFGHDNADQKWKKVVSGSFDWYIRHYFQPGFPSTAFKSRVTEGSTKWGQVGRDFWFASTTNGAIRVMDITYEDLLWPNGDSWAIETNWKQFGCCEIFYAIISFNSTPQGFGWYTGTGTPGPNQGDVISIATHEFGHAVALNHSSASADVMWQYINAGQVKRTLTAHDKDGISWFYPVH
jgi:predicted Zn-dependent protease